MQNDLLAQVLLSDPWEVLLSNFMPPQFHQLISGGNE
jgi:hypothetical protein